MGPGFKLRWLWSGIAFESPEPEAEYSKEEVGQYLVANNFLALLALCMPGGWLMILLVHHIPITPALGLLLALPALYGLIIFWIPRQWPRLQPMLPILIALCQLLLDANSIATLAILAATADVPSECIGLQSEWIAVLFVAQSAWFGYCVVLIGYTKAGAIAMLLKPLLLAWFVFGSSSMSMQAWYCVLQVVPLSVCAIWMSMKVSLIHRREFAALHQVAVMRAEAKQQKHSAAVNHVVKNSMVDAAAAILVLLGEGTYPRPALDNVLAILSRGIRWCKNYQTCTNLMTGVFSLCLQPVGLEQFGRDLVAGRRVLSYFTPVAILTDARLCDIMMENALDNAAKHGHATDPQVRCSVVVSEEDADGTARVTFTISNKVNAGVRLPKNIWDLVGDDPTKLPIDLSVGLGLKHCRMAARALGMQVELTQSEDVVTFSASMPVDVVAPDEEHIDVQRTISQVSVPCLSPVVSWAFGSCKFNPKLMCSSLPPFLPPFVRLSVCPSSSASLPTVLTPPPYLPFAAIEQQPARYCGASVLFAVMMPQTFLQPQYSSPLCCLSVAVQLQCSIAFCCHGAAFFFDATEQRCIGLRQCSSLLCCYSAVVFFAATVQHTLLLPLNCTTVQLLPQCSSDSWGHCKADQ